MANFRLTTSLSRRVFRSGRHTDLAKIIARLRSIYARRRSRAFVNFQPGAGVIYFLRATLTRYKRNLITCVPAQLRNRIRRIVQNAIFDSFAVMRGRSFQTRRTKTRFTIGVMAKITTP